MAKSKPKTIRFSIEAENFIEQFEGKNFSDKIHNLIKFYTKHEQIQKEKIKRLDIEISDKHQRLDNLNNYLFKIDHIEREFRILDKAIKGCQRYLEHFLVKDLEKKFM